MATLTSTYQYLGRSSVMTSQSGSSSYYILLYGKTVANETTGIHTVTIKEILASTSTNATFYQYTTSHNGKINDEIVFSGSNEPNAAWELSNFSAGGYTYKTGTLIGEGSTEIDATDGTEKDVTLSCYWSFNHTGTTYTPANGTSRTVSVTATLPAILRATTPTLESDSYEMGTTITISTPRINDSFTHKLYYQVNNSAKTQFATGVETSVDWSDNLFLINWINTDTKATVTIYCHTYNGSTYIGEKSVSFTGYVPDSVVPIVNSLTVSEAETDVADKVGVYVKGKSKLNVSASASGSYASTISSYKLEVNGETFASTEELEITTALLYKSGEQEVKLTVIDSRKRTTIETIPINVVDYYLPIATGISVDRCESDGTLNDDGEYLKATFSYDIAPIDNLNSKSVSIQYLNEEQWETITTFDSYNGANQEYISTQTFDTNNSYQIKLLVEDTFTSDEATSSLPTAFTLMNYHSSGTGIGIGKVAEKENTLDINLDVEMQKDLNVVGDIKGASVEADGDIKGNNLTMKGDVSGNKLRVTSILVNGQELPKHVNEESTSTIDGYSCDYINNLNTYSTDEQVIGTWFGKPLYRKVITTTETIDTNSVLSLETGISDAEMIWIDRENSYIYNNNNTVEGGRLCYPIPYNVAPSETSTYIGVCMNGTNIELLSNGGWNYLWTKVITVKYTKTTD